MSKKKFSSARFIKSIKDYGPVELARRLEVSRQTIHLWRQGRLPGLDNLFQVAHLTKRDMAWFYE